MWFLGLIICIAGIVITSNGFDKRRLMTTEQKQAVNNKADKTIVAGIAILIAGIIWIYQAVPDKAANVSNNNSMPNTAQSTKNQSTPNNQSSNAPATNVQSQPAPQLSSSGVSSNVTIEVLGMATEGSIGDEKAKGVFKIIHIKVTNNQKDAITISGSSYKLIDEQGREFSHSTDALFELPRGQRKMFTNQLNPGLSDEGFIPFDVPKDAKGFKLQASGGMMGTNIFLKVD